MNAEACTEAIQCFEAAIPFINQKSNRLRILVGGNLIKAGKKAELKNVMKAADNIQGVDDACTCMLYEVARFFLRSGDYLEAEQCCTKAISLAAASLHLAACKLLLGRIISQHAIWDQFAAATDCLLESFEISVAHKITDYIKDILHQLNHHYSYSGRNQSFITSITNLLPNHSNLPFSGMWNRDPGVLSARLKAAFREFALVCEASIKNADLTAVRFFKHACTYINNEYIQIKPNTNGVKDENLWATFFKQTCYADSFYRLQTMVDNFLKPGVPKLQNIIMRDPNTFVSLYAEVRGLSAQVEQLQEQRPPVISRKRNIDRDPDEDSLITKKPRETQPVCTFFKPEDNYEMLVEDSKASLPGPGKTE